MLKIGDKVMVHRRVNMNSAYRNPPREWQPAVIREVISHSPGTTFASVSYRVSFDDGQIGVCF